MAHHVEMSLPAEPGCSAIPECQPTLLQSVSLTGYPGRRLLIASECLPAFTSDPAWEDWERKAMLKMTESLERLIVGPTHLTTPEIPLPREV